MQTSLIWYIALGLVFLALFVWTFISVYKSCSAWRSRNSEKLPNVEAATSFVAYDTNRASMIYSQFFEVERTKYSFESSIRNGEIGTGDTPLSTYPNNPAMAAQLYNSIRRASQESSQRSMPTNTPRMSQDMSEVGGYRPYLAPYVVSSKQSSRHSSSQSMYNPPPSPTKSDSEAEGNHSRRGSPGSPLLQGVSEENGIEIIVEIPLS